MFADCLRSLREKAGISQYRLAKRSGVSKHMVSRLELGTRQPSWETVQRLANALGVDCRSFVDPDLRMPVGETAIRERGLATRAQAHGLATREEQKAGYAKNAEMPNGQPAFRQERSRHVVSDSQAGADEAASAFGDRPARPGQNVDIHIALDPEVAEIIRWLEANFCRLPDEPFRLSECSLWWDDPKPFYEDCKAMCEAIKRNDPRADPEWFKRWVGMLRERFEGKL